MAINNICINNEFSKIVITTQLVHNSTIQNFNIRRLMKYEINNNDRFVYIVQFTTLSFQCGCLLPLCFCAKNHSAYYWIVHCFSEIIIRAPVHCIFEFNERNTLSLRAHKNKINSLLHSITMVDIWHIYYIYHIC